MEFWWCMVVAHWEKKQTCTQYQGGKAWQTAALGVTVTVTLAGRGRRRFGLGLGGGLCLGLGGRLGHWLGPRAVQTNRRATAQQQAHMPEGTESAEWQAHQSTGMARGTLKDHYMRKVTAA